MPGNWGDIINLIYGDDKAKGVLLESGESLYADVLVAATGVHPNLEFLDGSGITHNWEITEDEYLQTDYAD